MPIEMLSSPRGLRDVVINHQNEWSDLLYVSPMEANQAMPTLPRQIADKFLEELEKSKDVTEAQVIGLKDLMERPSKLKATDIEVVFTAPKEVAL